MATLNEPREERIVTAVDQWSVSLFERRNNHLDLYLLYEQHAGYHFLVVIAHRHSVQVTGDGNELRPLFFGGHVGFEGISELR